MLHHHRIEYARLAGQTAALFLFLAAIPISQAQSINPGLDDAFQLRGGPFFVSFDTTVRVQRTDFDQDALLGHDKTTFGVFAKWRITPKLHLNLGYSQISRDDTTTFSAATPIGGITVPAGTALAQDYETSNVPIALAYTFVKKPKTEFGVEAGVAVTKIKNTVRISVPGVPTITPVSDDTTEPLQSIGLFWHQAFSPQWMFVGSARYLGLDIGDIDADFVDAFAGIEWRPFKNVGFGAAYLYNNANGTIKSAGTKSDF
jgi:long-subunit fatty acid transport protein